jgi:hypothetical protein
VSRHGYTEDCDETWDHIRWRGAVAAAIKGKRGQAFLLEMFRAMEELPVKKLVTDMLQDEYEDAAVCALGSVGRARGMNMEGIDIDDYEEIAAAFGIPNALAQEIMWENDEGPWHETAEKRFHRLRKWIIGNLKPVDVREVAEGGEHDSHGSEPPSA